MLVKAKQYVCRLMCLKIVIRFLLLKMIIIEMGKVLQKDKQPYIHLSILLKEILSTRRAERCYFLVAFLA